MALKSTICKALLRVSDIDRGYYHDHALTVARHPSETDERMMTRLLAFAMHADDRLEFGRGLSADDEPDLWQRDRTGSIERWIDVGLPDEREVRKACGRAREVHVLAYGGRAVDLWWQGARDKLERQDRLAVSAVDSEQSRALAGLVNRTMQLQVTLQEGYIFIADGTTSVPLEIRALKSLSTPSRRLPADRPGGGRRLRDRKGPSFRTRQARPRRAVRAAPRRGCAHQARSTR